MKIEFTPKLLVGQCAWMVDPDTAQIRACHVRTIIAHIQTATPIISYLVSVLTEEGVRFVATPVRDEHLHATVADAMGYLSPVLGDYLEPENGASF